MGNSVMSGVLIPKAFPAKACPNSCNTTHANNNRMNKTPPTAADEPPWRIIGKCDPRDQQQKRDVNPQLDPGNTKDWNRPAHAN